MKFNTKTIHGGQHHEKVTGAVMPPVFQTSTYVQTSPGKPVGDYEYSRAANPTRTALEDALASIENGARGLAFSSGLAATDCLLRLFKAGDEIIAMDDLYGGTYRLFTRLYKDSSIKFHFVDMNDLKKFQSLINENTKLVWVETPTNPLMKLADIAAIAQITKRHNILFAVDNTFATPYLQKPLDLGADIVMHSATKYLGGHSDICAGAVACSQEHIEKIWNVAKNLGGSLSEYTVWLLERSMKTLAIRVKAHNKNAKKIAKWLHQHPLVNQVYYPGLKTHPSYKLAKKQMKGFGGMLTFDLAPNLDCKQFLLGLKLIKPTMSLAGIESTALSPRLTSHALLTEEERIAQGINSQTIRFSTGIEAIEDLKADLLQSVNQQS